MPLFEVAILERPTKKQGEEGQGERLVLKPTAVVASDQQAAGIIVALDPEINIDVDRNRMEVIVRPFA